MSNEMMKREMQEALNAGEQVDDAIRHVERILNDLKRQMNGDM